MIQDQLNIAAALQPITDREFAQFQKLIYGTAGIHLAPHKKALLEARLSKHIRKLGFRSYGSYYKYVIREQRGEELIHLLDRVSTNETHFFREPRQLEFLENRVFAEWRTQTDAGIRPRSIRVWSAGCSSGEEPCSIAMMLLEHFPPANGWEVEILATDLSTRVLDHARKAIWPIGKAQEIPEKYLKRFMLCGTGSQHGNMKAGPEILSRIRFERLNLNDERYPVTGRFDAIFCRNVLIYFDAQSRSRAVERLLDHLVPSGYLFLGHAETLSGVTERARHLIPTVYVRTEKPQEATGNRSAAI